MSQMVESALFAVALTGTVKKRQVLGRAGLQETAFKSGGQQLGMARADKAADADRSAAGNGGDGFIGSGNFSGGTQRGGRWLVFRDR